MRHCRKCHALAIGRFDGILNQANFHRTFFDALRKIEFGAEIQFHIGGERNNGFRAGRQVQAADFAVLVVENFLAVREEGISRKKIARENSFLIVARDGIAHPTVFAGFEIAQAQAGFRFVTRYVQQPLPSGENTGRKLLRNCSRRLSSSPVLRSRRAICQRGKCAL